MTTIVYDHKNKQIAIDSRECAGDEIKTDNAIKYKEHGGIVYFLSGHTSDMQAFIGLDKKRGVNPDVEIKCSALFVRDGKAFKASFADGEYWELELPYSDSIGSGGVYALCAIDFGKSAFEAVEYAKTRDSCSGGKVHVYDIETMRFI